VWAFIDCAIAFAIILAETLRQQLEEFKRLRK